MAVLDIQTEGAGVGNIRFRAGNYVEITFDFKKKEGEVLTPYPFAGTPKIILHEKAKSARTLSAGSGVTVAGSVVTWKLNYGMEKTGATYEIVDEVDTLKRDTVFKGQLLPQFDLLEHSVSQDISPVIEKKAVTMQVNITKSGGADTGGNGEADHTHANKTTLDQITVAYTTAKDTELAANTTARHTHTNKTLLDNTTGTFTTARETKLDALPTSTDLTTALAGKQPTVSLTTTGTSGTATFNPVTGALNIPNYTTSGTGVTDGDKGDVVVSNSGATWTVEKVYTKSDVGLSNVDNTSDAAKPISTATQAALNNKAPLVNGLVPEEILPEVDFPTYSSETPANPFVVTTPGGVQTIGISSAFLQAFIVTYLQSLPGFVNDGTVSLRGNLTWQTSGASQPQLATPSISTSVISSTQINITVGSVTNATAYVLEWSANGTSGWTSLSTTSGTYNHTGLSASTPYYYRVKATASGYTDSAYATANATTQAAPAGFDYNSLPGLALLLDANTYTDADGSTMASVTEQSPNAYVLTGAGTTNPVLTHNAVNSKKAFTFGGSSRFNLPAGALGMFNNKTFGAFHMVLSFDNLASGRNLINFDRNSSGSSRFYLSTTTTPAYQVQARREDSVGSAIYTAGTPVANTWGVLSVVMDWANNDVLVYVNGTLVGSNTSFLTTGATSATDSVAAAIGASTSGVGGLVGKIAKVVIYNAPQTSQQVTDAITNLKSEYGIA